MDILAQIFLIVSGASFAIATMLAIFSHHRDLVILFTWVGVISLITSGFAWFQDREWKRDADISEANQPAINKERPWVALVLVTLSRPLKVGEKPSVEVTFHNSGQSPALDTSMAGRLRIDFYELPEGSLKDVPTTGPEGSKMPLIFDANAGGPIEMSEPLDQQHLDAIRNGTMALYLIGEIKYRDSKAKYRTKFCLFIKGDKLDDGSLEYYKDGNTME